MIPADGGPPPPGGEGEIVVAALARVLDRLRDRLAAEGPADAADFVAELADAAHDYAARPRRGP